MQDISLESLIANVLWKGFGLCLILLSIDNLLFLAYDADCDVKSSYWGRGEIVVC